VKTHFWFVMLACVGLICATGYADRTASEKRPDQTGHPPRKPQRSRRGGPARSNLPKPLPRRPPVRSPGPVGAAEPPLSNVRHRSPNPAIIAGSAELSKRSTGAIDGKQVHRRP
jgi:hypothetical protein